MYRQSIDGSIYVTKHPAPPCPSGYERDKMDPLRCQPIKLNCIHRGTDQEACRKCPNTRTVLYCSARQSKITLSTCVNCQLRTE